MPQWKAYFTIAWACKTPFVLCLDRVYRLLDPVQLEAVVSGFPQWEYVPELSDCDDAAHAFRAYAGHGIGIALTGKHAWNIALCTDGVRHIEPQNRTMTRNKWALAIVI